MLNKIKWLIAFLFALMLSSCGGGSTTWGIDQDAGKSIPVCNGDIDSTTNAITVKAGQKVKKVINPTIVRIWHYQNGEKKICVVQGKAVINE